MGVNYCLSKPLPAISRKDRATLEATLESGDWIVYDLQSAEQAISEYIRETIWSFNPDMLEHATTVPAVVFKVLGDLGETANSAVLDIVEGKYSLKLFVQDCISADGRGTFLASYDSNETIIKVGKYELYCYRVG